MVSLKLHVHVDNAKFMMNVQTDPAQLLVDIFAKIAAKRGLVNKPELYKFREYNANDNFEETVLCGESHLRR
ncbi:MAG: hypothetical protein P4M11_07100 [Candidatus Pacebacteria bacterium]|nr:hypothetical protein [Candidatus Paceibacterota bacterium]